MTGSAEGPGQETPTIRTVAEAVQVVDVTDALTEIEQRFGIPLSTWDDFVIFRPNSKWLAIADRHLELPVRPELSGLGMPFLYPRMRYPRFTTAAAIRFGPLATRHVIDLEDATYVGRLIDLETLPFDPEPHPLVDAPGHLLIRHRGMLLGLANSRIEDSGWTLTAMLPKAWRDMLGP